MAPPTNSAHTKTRKEYMQLVGYFYTNLVIDFTLGLLCDYSSIYLGFFRGVDGPSELGSALLSSVSFSGGRLIKYIIKILTDYFKPNTDSLYYLSRRHNLSKSGLIVHGWE